MARVREFDPAEALDKAMRLFWRKGYAETSVRDLVRHTGVAHAGLYAAFGDKRQLYRAALGHYDATYGKMLIGPLEKPGSGRAEIEGFFVTLVEGIKSKRFEDGCFMCNTAIEFGHEDGDILSISRGNFERMRSAFQGALTRARDRGEVEAGLDPATEASFLTSVFHGVVVLARAKIDAKQIDATVHVALGTLG